MSTNKTEHLQLHQWEKNDAFHTEEINENFAKIDTETAATREGIATRVAVVAGSYVGNGSIQGITLGFRPKAVFIPTDSLFCGVACEGGNGLAVLTDQGFQVSYSQATGYHINAAGKVYQYIALK